ncbi:MAG: MarR family transcriptional regulator [Spirochaetes bacterium]|nr:MarR family transcriptional regulator [Spirochaetota bacterium]
MVTQENIVRFLKAMNRISRVFASMENSASDTSLNKLELTTLEYISKEHDLIMSKLAGGLGIGLSTATGIIDRLIEKNLVTRERNHGDRRVVKVALSVKGEKIISGYQIQKKKAIEKMMNMLSEKEQEYFISILEKIANASKED